jgi:septum site-determining protein MinC
MTETRPFIRLRGRSIMALVLTPEPPLAAWLAALDAQIERAPNFFDGRPVIVDVGPLPSDMSDVAGLMREIASRGIHIIGTEGAHPSWTGLEEWGRLPGAGKPGKPIDVPQPAAPPPPTVAEPPVPPPPAYSAPTQSEVPSLLIDRSVRSGQLVSFESGDITVLGSVASGAEVVAGGSIHVYGALRGRAVAGLTGGGASRIYCSKLHAELVAIDGVYQTAEDMPPERIGGPACAWLDGDQMRITSLE